ncbi:MAG: recombinase family protein [Nitrospirae bacterium]|nr:recombinase family protein [Nitrospirota bacterium]
MRLSGGRHNKARKGLHAGGRVPVGYKAVDKDLAVSDEATETIKAIYTLRDNGLSLRAIADTLNEQGMPSVSGRPWAFSTVRYILNNVVYRGTLAYKGNTSTRIDLALV